MNTHPSAELKLLVLNGSPNHDGDTMRLAGRLAQRLGARPDIVHLYDEGPGPCRACHACSRGAPCPLADGMDGLMERVDGADCVVLASPLHFTSLTAPMIAFISRLQPWWHGGRRLTPERVRAGALVVCGGSDYEDMFRPARSVAAAAFKALGIRFAGMAGRAGTDAVPVVKGDDNDAGLLQLTERIRACSDGL